MHRYVFSKQARKSAAVAAVLLSLGLTACATTSPPAAVAGLPPASTVLAAGAPVTAPDGFLNLCMRSPTDCAVEDSFAERIRVAAEARELSRQRWRAIFSARFASLGAEPPAAAPAATEPAARVNVADTRPASIGPAFAAAAFEARAPETDAADAAIVTPSVPPLLPSLDLAALAAAPAGDAVPLDAATWAALTAVNREVNRKIRKASDREAFGVEDWWAAPLSQGLAARGDCEDYVLEKRRALIARGVPARALSIVLARTSWGEPHAVLLVATDRGDYVLDNLSPKVKPWRALDYVWTARQSPGNQLSWASLEGAG